MDASGQHTDQVERRWAARCRATVTALVTAALVALAACGQAATAHSGATATPRVTGTPDSVIRLGPQATWQPITMPPEQAGHPIAVAATNGDVAYACDVVRPKGDGTTHTWATRDRAQYWTAGGTIAGPTGATMCNLTVDTNNPNVIVATLSNASGGSSPPVFLADSSYASFDGGATWREIAAGEAIGHVASYNGMYYAARVYETCATCPMIGNLAVSSDQMATWKLIGPDQSIAGTWFWLNPQTGSILVFGGGSTGGNSNGALIRSDDGGARWDSVNLPSWTQNVLAVPQAGAQPWQLCAVATTLTGGPSGDNQLACSADGGQTWTAHPALYLTNLSPKGFTYVEPAFAFAIANDGAILATASDSSGITHLYRLPSGSSTWQTLGPLNGIASCSYSNGPGAGVLWQNIISSPAPYLTASYPKP